MKKLLVVLIILAVVAGGGFYWWQQNSNRIITRQVRKLAGRFFVNPENLTVENSTIKPLGLHKARVAKLTISGKELVLRDGPALAQAKVVLQDIEVSGPPFRLTHVGDGSYEVKVTDRAVTEYIHKRGGSVAGVKIIPLDTITVAFVPSQKAAAKLQGTASLPPVVSHLPVTATGTLASSRESGRIDFLVDDVQVKNIAVPVKRVAKLKESFRLVNPIVNLSEWPVTIDVSSIKTLQGVAVVRGTVTGVDDSIFRAL